MKGTLIVFEGIDGSGKATQAKLLVKRLRAEGRRAEMVDFPRYGKKSAWLVEEYLRGEYGTPQSVGPYRASIFFACDRYAASFGMRKLLQAGTTVVADRYTTSSAGHQAGKIRDARERKKFLAWLFDLEYHVFGIPKPDATILLKTTPKISEKLCAHADVHENDPRHLARALTSYLSFAKQEPGKIAVIECVGRAGSLLSPKEIHERIWHVLPKLIKRT